MSVFPTTQKSVPKQPELCPFCRSQSISTTSKAVSDATYWRCGTCGQIWNQSRLPAWKYS